MAMIKSALELALERTKDLKVDEAALEVSNIKMEARRAAGKYLEDLGQFDLAKAVKDSGAQVELFRKTAFEVLIAQIQLPSSYFDPDKLALLGSGLGILSSLAPYPAKNGGKDAQKKVEDMVKQITSFMEKYLEELKRVDQAIRTQWAPKLRDKERQMAARMGREVRMDPMSDPEFSAFYKQNVESLRDQYSEALERARAALFELALLGETTDDSASHK